MKSRSREEYEAERERLDDLKAQREDLERSLEEPERLRAELSDTVERRFAETLASVADGLEEVATTLFPGGEGRLRLVDADEDGSEPGIEVELRPAARITRLGRCWGEGRRDLVPLLALPRSPVRVLPPRRGRGGARRHEHRALRRASAALRWTGPVRRRHGHQRTMEAADVLYGVTMGPDGVSQVVSRRLPQHARTRLRNLPPVSYTWEPSFSATSRPRPTSPSAQACSGAEQSLAKSRRALNAELASATFDPGDELAERLEEAPIRSDVGVPVTAELVRRLEARGDPGPLEEVLADEVAGMFGGLPSLALTGEPSVILVVGVNGTGKTTTIGKLARSCGSTDGRSSSAPRTPSARRRRSSWRSGRSGQRRTSWWLTAWSRPAAVAFDAVEAARARGHDVAIIDTAGRPHTQANPMAELGEGAQGDRDPRRGRTARDALVVDATTGQNGLQQARLFGEAVGVSPGVALTKLDGSARAGSRSRSRTSSACR